MKMRILFRGLMAYKWESFDPETGDRDGPMAALLVNQSGSTGHHVHRPRMSWFGRDELGKYPLGVPLPIGQRKIRFEWDPPDGAPPSVQRDPSFTNHVQSLTELIGKKGPWPISINAACYDFGGAGGTPVLQDPVASQVIVPGGTIRTSDLVNWWVPSNAGAHSPKFPQDVKFTGSTVPKRKLASECLVEAEVPNAKLKIISKPYGESAVEEVLATLTPFNTCADPYADLRGHDLTCDTVEILITNFSPRRRFPIPWSIHFRWLFDLLDTDVKTLLPSQAAIAALTKPAKMKAGGNLVGNLETDLQDATTNKDLPFPYIEDPKDPAGGSLLPFHEPYYRPICPAGEE